jgi:RTX calcium-binding nonapeptide repeat (4 copies)
MIKKLLRPKVFVASLVLLISLSAFTAMSAANIVPVTHIDDSQRPIRVRDLAPPECASIANSLTSISVGGYVSWVHPQNTLILGTSAGETFWALFTVGTGPNCIVAGSGDDGIYGSNHAEIIIGGPGNDTINGGGGYDICYGGGGTDSFSNCEETY